MPVSQSLHYCGFEVDFEIRSVRSTSFSRLFLAILGPLQFHMNFRISLSITERKKKAAGILIGIVLNLVINLGSIAILTILSVPIQVYKTRISFDKLYLTRKLLFSARFSDLLIKLYKPLSYDILKFPLF